jgi:hypothetical protein
MNTLEEPKPSKFINGNFVAECIEKANGGRSIVFYNKKTTIYEHHSAIIHDPITIFKLANWMVKASNWVGQQKIYRHKKRNRIQPTD